MRDLNQKLDLRVITEEEFRKQEIEHREKIKQSLLAANFVEQENILDRKKAQFQQKINSIMQAQPRSNQNPARNEEEKEYYDWIENYFFEDADLSA